MSNYDWLFNQDEQQQKNIEQWVKNWGQLDSFSNTKQINAEEESTLRQSINSWKSDQIFHLMKHRVFNKNFLRQVYGNFSELDKRRFEHEMKIDTMFVRFCSIQLLINYINYIKEFPLKYNPELKEYENLSKFYRRLSGKYGFQLYQSNGQIYNYVGPQGNIIDRIVI